MVKIDNCNGSISITSDVFTNLAGDAATNCFGVKGMAGRSKEGGPLQLLRRESMSKGVEVQFNDDGSVSLELHIGVDQGVNIALVRGFRQTARNFIERDFLLGVEAHDIGQHTQRIARFTFGLDTIERRLRQSSLRQQAISRRAGTHLVTAFSSSKTFTRRPLGLGR